MNTINILAMKIVNNNIIEYGVSASGVCREKRALQFVAIILLVTLTRVYMCRD